MLHIQTCAATTRCTCVSAHAHRWARSSWRSFGYLFGYTFRPPSHTEMWVRVYVGAYACIGRSTRVCTLANVHMVTRVHRGIRLWSSLWMGFPSSPTEGGYKCTRVNTHVPLGLDGSPQSCGASSCWVPRLPCPLSLVPLLVPDLGAHACVCAQHA